MEIENVLNKEFANVCARFVDNKLSIHFGEDKIKCIFLSREKNPARAKRNCEIVFHTLFVCGLYFVQYRFMQVCIFYQFF